MDCFPCGKIHNVTSWFCHFSPISHPYERLSFSSDGCAEGNHSLYLIDTLGIFNPALINGSLISNIVETSVISDEDLEMLLLVKKGM